MLKNGLDRTALELFEYGVRLEEPEDMLYWAAAGGCPEFIRNILTRGVVDVNHTFVNNQTALHLACSFNKYDAAMALIEDPEIGHIYFQEDDFFQSPASYARRNDMSGDLIEYLDQLDR